MKRTDEQALRERIWAVLPTLNEFQRRRYLSAEAKTIGYGGISQISRITGVSRQMLMDGIAEIESDENKNMPIGKSRRAGGGRKTKEETQPGILEALKELVDAHTQGNPMCDLLHTNKSRKTIQKGLIAQGFEISCQCVGNLLKKLGYGLQANKKTLTTTPSHPDRDEQFEYINDETKKAHNAGNPVISIDAKKKEKVGNFKNDRKTYQPHKTPTEVLDHDFPIKELGKATPYGVYDIFKNKGFVNVGISADTASFAVESIRKWWNQDGALYYQNATEIVITADAGGSNGYRNRLWKYELQHFSNEIGKSIKVLHFPPGTSKWNKIEHRLFSFVSMNWKGIPLISLALIVSLIGATTTEPGLITSCVLDESIYIKGRKVTDEELSSVSIHPADFHGEWNYTIIPNYT